MVRRTPHRNSPPNIGEGPPGAPKASHVKEVLITLRDRLQAHLGNEEDNNLAMLRDLRDSSRDQLMQINEALARIDEGNYGICANCLATIAADRLVARPYSTLCRDCQNHRAQAGQKRN